MILHSVAPLWQLLPPDAQPQLSCVEFEGGLLLGREGQEGLQITQVVSTDPRVYLDERYAPGSIYRRPGDSKETSGI